MGSILKKIQRSFEEIFLFFPPGRSFSSTYMRTVDAIYNLLSTADCICILMSQKEEDRGYLNSSSSWLSREPE